MNEMSSIQAISDEQQEILAGLLESRKYINPKYFYNHRGSQLFEEITELDEYYPTRTELAILQSEADDIARHLEQGALIIEPGAGNCSKIEYLLDTLKPKVYAPQDVSARFLFKSAKRLAEQYPWLTVEPIVSDFSEPIVLPDKYRQLHKQVFYPGSTIGNFEPEEAVQFLRQMHQLVGEGGGVLLGVDLHKDESILHAAYNDEQGITAQFNLNTLHHINQLLGSEIDVERFEHRAVYNRQQQRIEMYLRSTSDQSYQILGKPVTFAKDEQVLTEHSYKYTLDGIGQMAQAAGFSLVRSWLDKNRWFSVNYLRC